MTETCEVAPDDQFTSLPYHLRIRVLDFLTDSHSSLLRLSETCRTWQQVLRNHPRQYLRVPVDSVEVRCGPDKPDANKTCINITKCDGVSYLWKATSFTGQSLVPVLEHSRLLKYRSGECRLMCTGLTLDEDNLRHLMAFLFELTRSATDVDLCLELVSCCYPAVARDILVMFFRYMTSRGVKELFLEDLDKASLLDVYDALCATEVHRLRVIRIAFGCTEYHFQIGHLCKGICHPNRRTKHIAVDMPPPELVQDACNRVWEVLQSLRIVPYTTAAPPPLTFVLPFSTNLSPYAQRNVEKMAQRLSRPIASPSPQASPKFHAAKFNIRWHVDTILYCAVEATYSS